MRKVLMISCYFPPLGGAGVQRSLKFTKYLPSFGWNPTVITIKNNNHGIKDATLEKEIPASIEIVRTKALLLPRNIPWRIKNWLTRWFLVIDEYLGWFPFACKDALKILRENKIHVLYTTSSPYTSHLIGLYLHKHTGVPWIADFRDPWIGNYEVKYPTPLHFALVKYLERSVVKTASAISVVSDQMYQSFVDRYPEITRNKIYVITNGFDQEDFLNLPPLQKSNKFTITYTGSFYSKGRTPENFLQGLVFAIERAAIPRDHIQVNFFGNISDAIQHQVDIMGLNDVVSLKGYVSHQESITSLMNADVLLLIIGNGPGSENIATGKIYEYIAAHRPILALANAGAASEIIKETNSGVIVSPGDISSISDQITNFYQQWEDNNLKFQGNDNNILKFDRKNLTGQLATILNKISR